MGMEKSIPLKVAAPSGAVVAGIILALFEVQGWNMPTPLAVLLLIILFGLLALFISAVCLSGIKTIVQLAEHNATSAVWISREVPGVLDCEVDGPRATNRLLKECIKINSSFQKYGKELMAQSKLLEELEIPNKKIKAKGKLKIANRIGIAIDHNAVYIEKRIKLFEILTNEITRNYRVMIETFNMTNERDRFSAIQLKSAFTKFDKAAGEILNAITHNKNAAELITKSNINRMVRLTSIRFKKALDDLSCGFIKFQNESQTLCKELETKLANVDSLIPDREDSREQ